jgi:hypothetical protein
MTMRRKSVFSTFFDGCKLPPQMHSQPKVKKMLASAGIKNSETVGLTATLWMKRINPDTQKALRF